MQHHNNKIDPDLLGKIMLARFLEMPLRGLDTYVTQVESSAGFADLRAYVVATRLRDAQALSNLCSSSSVLGKFQAKDGDLALSYCRESFVREYLFDDQALAEHMSRNSLPKEQAAILSKLRLINTRNRLTQALMQAVLASQKEYLRSGNNLSLVPLTQAQISTKLISEANLSVVADPGRISRLIRRLSIMLPNDQTVALGKLFPKARQTHCHAISNVIAMERTSIAKGILADPLPDEAIAAVLARDHGIRVSRRTVANVRRDLAIPDSRRRGRRMNYLTTTAGFSTLLPLTLQTLCTEVPVHPGVYEIRASLCADRAGERQWDEQCALPHPHVVYIQTRLPRLRFMLPRLPAPAIRASLKKG